MATVVIPNSRAGVKARTNGYRCETVFSQQVEVKVWMVKASPAAAGRSKFYTFLGTMLIVPWWVS